MNAGARRLLPLAVAGAIAVLAFDPERWIRGWIFAAAQAVAVAAVALLVIVDVVADDRAGSRSTPDRRLAPPIALLAAWVAWSAAGPGAASTAAWYAVIAVGLLRVWHHDRRPGSGIAVATVLAGALVGHLGVAAAVASITTIDPVLSGRLTLVSLEANELARVAAIGTVAASHLVLRGRPGERVLGLTAGLAGASAVVLTGSRTGAVAVAIGVAIVLLLEAPRWLIAAALTIGAVVGAMALTFDLASLPGTNALERSTDGLGSLNGRNNFWPRLLDATEHSRVSGIGLGNDRDFIQAEVPTGWNAQHAHNLALHLLVTTGVVGVALFASSVGASLVRAAARPPGDPAATLALALLAVVLVDGVTEAVVRTPSFGWAAVVAAAALSAPRAEPLP
ncbi:MAG: O-antigen ligase family protein [Acidimicrobiales bacterium]